MTNTTSRRDAFSALIAFAATAPTIDHLETLFDLLYVSFPNDHNADARDALSLQLFAACRDHVATDDLADAIDRELSAS